MFTIIYKKKLSSPLNSTSNCSKKQAHASPEIDCILWTVQVSATLDCPQVKQFDQIHNVQLHVNESKKVYRAEISQLHIRLHSQTTCSSSVFTCFSCSIVCDPSGIILQPHTLIFVILKTRTFRPGLLSFPSLIFS